MNRHYFWVADRAGHRCEYCHAPEKIFNFHFEVDHIFPSSLGGTDTEENFALACTACNLFKSDLIEAFDEATQSFVRLFHPRLDSWQDHFEVDREAATIQGQTDIGRVTVLCLKINSPRQIRARLEWMQMGIFQ
jgi:hypothetical protein